jgi:hypothetical protein
MSSSRPLKALARAIFLMALAFTPWIHADTASLTPTADAYVRNGANASTNYGTSTRMETRNNSSAHRRSYLKFDISSINGTVSDAKLGLYANTSSSTQTTDAYSVSDTTWTETGITWNNMPSLGSSLDSIDIDTSSYTYWELDVTSHIAAAVAASQSYVTIALENSTDNSAVNKFRSREYTTTSHRPSLDITYTAGGGTAPSISAHPQNDTVDVGEDATFSVTASGNPTPTYQWRFEGSNISGAVSNSLSLTDVQTSDAGDYDVVVTNSNGTVTSNTATLTVNTPAIPIIDEDFSGSAGDFTEVDGGTWSVSSGHYNISSPNTAGNGLLGNISVHDTAITGNEYSLSAVVNITGTASAWNDAALIFGYQDDSNFYYVSINESNDSYTKGIFKIVSGTPTELVDLGSLSISSDIDYTIEVVRDGSSIVIYLNSSQVASTTDSTFSGGHVGFGTKNDSAQFDDLVVYGTATASQVDTPMFSPGGGTYSSAQSVSITTSTSGATIRYTTDGSTPTSTTGTIYSSAVSISSTSTLKAIAYKSGMVDSSVTSATYTINTGTVAAPQFSPAGGTYSSSQSVAITTSTSGATIRYTTDGSTPTSTTGTLYSSAVSISSTTTLKAIAYKSGMTDSSVTTAAYTISGSGPTKPNASNTGTSGSLTASSGFTITTDNAVIEDLDISGTVKVQANNVTIRNCRISTGGYYGIQCTFGYTGLLIEDCEIEGMQSAGIYGSNFTARRVHIHNSGADAIKPGSNFVIESCYLTDLGYITTSHADGVQMVSGGDGVIRWNNFDMPHDEPGYKNSQCIIIQTNNGLIDDVVIHENWINGGGYSVQIRDKGNGYGAPTNIEITDNQFGRDYQFGIMITDGSPTISGNVWEDNGQPAP